ncbi:MAG: gamma-glutamyltransferase family protein, partial [Sphingomonadales bacterium]|nr:gamma-glutamyltransferase family protein [Sphingomonadales bacterium]
IATMLALNVVEPQSSGMGGGTFFVRHDATSGKINTIDGREAAPMAADGKWFYDANGKPLSHFAAVPGGRSVGVPGQLRVMAMAHAQSGKLPWARLFQPAIRLARDGFQASPRLANALVQYSAHMDANGRAIFMDASGKPWPAGTVIKNPKQAELFDRVARLGPAAFYAGGTAQRLVATVNNAQRNPSKMTVSDIASYRAKPRAPLCGSYRAYRVCGMGPPSSGGFTVLMILKQLERFDMTKLGKDSPVAWHLFAESSRLAYADRDMYLGDPDFVSVPLTGLLSRTYIASRSALISPDKSIADVAPGTPPGAPPRKRVPASETPGTTDLVVTDKAGNVVEVTTTIEGPWGSGLSVDGIMLNNELTDFDIVPDKDGYLVANRVGPGKRPRSSMAPTIVYGPDGKVRLAIGAAGGSTIIAQVAKAIVAVVDWKMSAQDAIGLGLVYAPGPMAVAESGTQAEMMVPQLRALGEKIMVSPLGLKANAIERVGGKWVGAADPRSEGVAMGQDGKMTVIRRMGMAPNRPSE